MSTQTKRLTYREYLKTPEIKARYDIVDGVMTMAPAPTVTHQRILLRLVRLLDQFVSEQQLGEVLLAPVDVIIGREPCAPGSRTFCSSATNALAFWETK